jgi:hypothetical protein
MSAIYEAVKRERKRQDGMWGLQEHPDALWCAILAEEFGEVAKEANETHFRGKPTDELEHELVQTMAVCAAWLEAIERRRG